MKKSTAIIPLFEKFIKDCETGKRLKKNGERMKQESIDNFTYTIRNLQSFSEQASFELRICDASKLNTREMKSEKNYWKKFYHQFTEYLYKKGLFDNYVGVTIKNIRTFFNYLQGEKDLDVGDFHKSFYVRQEEIDIHVLSPEQLKYLIHDKAFEASLSIPLKRTKEMFVFGCTTGLRFSDLQLLNSQNFVKEKGEWYLKIKSKKTKTNSSFKLPEYAMEIVKPYLKRNSNKPIFTDISLYNFNKNIKKVGKLAGFTKQVEITRERQGKAKNINPGKQKNQVFYEIMSSHMMRRTAITTYLILGMPEHLVKKISGHSFNSKSFGRYVHYAQAFVDQEIDKVHARLSEYWGMGFVFILKFLN